MYKIKIITFVVLVLVNGVAFALKEIPVPDTTQSKEYFFKKHNEILKTFNEKIGKLQEVQKGSSYGELGMFYQAHDFFTEAKVCYENAIELSKHDARWSYLLGYLETLEGNMDAGNKLYKRVIDINSKYLPAYERLAKNEVESGHFKEAQLVYNELIEMEPTFAKAFVGLGTINMQQGNADRAIEYFRQALKLQPNANQVYYLIAQAYAYKGDIEAAKQYRERQGNRPVVMYDAILQEMHLHSINPAYYAQSALNAFMSQNYVYAEKLVNKAIAMDPKDINPKYTLLNIYLTTRKDKKARELTYKLLKNHPNNERLYYVLGLTYDHEKNYDKAVEFYKKALLINPKNKSVNLNLSEVYLLSRDFNSALDKFKVAQKLDAEDPYPLFKEALILSHLNKCKKAVPIYLKAIDKSPENFEYLTGFVNAVARCDGLDEGVKVDALNAARNMYNIRPDISVIEALASIELAQGNKQNAIDYQAQAIFQGVSNKVSQAVLVKLKKDFELVKKGIVPK